MSTVRDKDRMWAEIETASRTFAGDSGAERVTAFLKTPEGARKYSEYQSAPFPEPETPKPPPAPPTLDQAARAFSESPTAPGSAWDLIEARARALAAKDAMSFAAAVKHVVFADPSLYEAYRANG